MSAVYIFAMCAPTRGRLVWKEVLLQADFDYLGRYCKMSLGSQNVGAGFPLKVLLRHVLGTLRLYSLCAL